MRALIVEPSKTYQLLIKEFLYGHSILHQEAKSGREALKILDEQDFDFICIAGQLTDMEGISLAQQIKAQNDHRELTIIILSGEHDPEKLQQLKTIDVDYVFSRYAITPLKNLFAQLSEDAQVSCTVNGHVLYVEDHLTLANMTIQILHEMGLTVEHFNNVDSAMIAFDENDFDLILLDIILPGQKDGLAMIQEIRARSGDKGLVPILAMSAGLNDTQRIDALRLGANDFIAKPVLQAELVVRTKNLISARQLYLQVIEQKEALEKMAMTDQLTGLYNRYFLMLYINKTLSSAKRHHHPVSLLMIDLDKFKHINDTFGHEKGDEILSGVATILRDMSREEDAPIRLGGDEFLLVLSQCPLEQAIQKANNICQAIADLSHDDIVSAASIGVSSTEQNIHDFEELLCEADKAAYRAKANNGNCVAR